jgi:hypothetical protein
MKARGGASRGSFSRGALRGKDQDDKLNLWRISVGRDTGSFAEERLATSHERGGEAADTVEEQAEGFRGR